MSVFDSAWSVLKAPNESYRVRYMSGARGTPKETSERKYLRNLFKTSILEGKFPASDVRLTPEQMMEYFGTEKITPEMLDFERNKKGGYKKDKDGKSIPLNPQILDRYTKIRDFYIKQNRKDFRSNPQKYGATASFAVGQDEVPANKKGDFSRLDNTTAMNPQAEREATPEERAMRALAGFKPTTRKEINQKSTEILRILNHKSTTDNFNQVRDLLYTMHPELKPKEKPPVDNTSTASRVASNLLTNPILPKDGDKQTTLDDFGGDLQEKPVVPKKPDKKTSKTTPEIQQLIERAEKLIKVANANEKAGNDVTATGHYERLDDVLERLKNQGVGLNEYNDTAKKLGIKRPQAADAVRPAPPPPPPPPSEDTQSNGGLPLTSDGLIDMSRLGEMFTSQAKAPEKAPAKAPVKVQQTTQNPTGPPTLASTAPTAAPTAAPELSERDKLVQRIRGNFGGGRNDPRVDRMLDEHKANNPIDDHLRLLGDVGHMGRLAEHVGVPIRQYSTVFQSLQENPENYGLSPDVSSADVHNHIMGMFNSNMAY